MDGPDCIVIGAGMSGLAAADALQREGRKVTIVEAGDTVGGLARSVIVAGEPIEPYYHHVFPQDAETREALRTLGLEASLEWRHASMAILHRGKVHPFDGPADSGSAVSILPPPFACDAGQVVRASRAMDTKPVAQSAGFGRSG